MVSKHRLISGWLIRIRSFCFSQTKMLNSVIFRLLESKTLTQRHGFEQIQRGFHFLKSGQFEDKENEK